jgi:hypothetical protein
MMKQLYVGAWYLCKVTGYKLDFCSSFPDCDVRGISPRRQIQKLWGESYSQFRGVGTFSEIKMARAWEASL